MKIEIPDDFSEDNYTFIGAYKYEKCGGSWGNTPPAFPEGARIPVRLRSDFAGFLPPEGGFYEEDGFLWRVIHACTTEFLIQKFDPRVKSYSVITTATATVTVEAESEEDALEIIRGFGWEDFGDHGFDFGDVDLGTPYIED